MIDKERLERILNEKYGDELKDTEPMIQINHATLSESYLDLAEKLITDYHYTKHAIEETINKMTIQNTRKKLKLTMVLPLTPINTIHQQSRGQLISTEGTVKKVTSIHNQLVRVAWKCNDCKKHTLVPIDYDEKIKAPKSACRHCNHKNGYRFDEKHSTFKDVQQFILQENLETVKSGYKPETLNCILEDAQVNTIKPGDKIRVNGIIELRNKKNENRFKEYMLTENIEQINKEFEDMTITPKEKKEFHRLAETTDIIDKFKGAIAPSLHGFEEVKEAITLQLFSTDTTLNSDGTISRGDIHILLIGDPGIGKSQILKSVIEIVPRGIYTSGKSSSGAGLTAAAVKDENDGWTLEAGAMVLADKGMVCIDEFDKMREEDRSAIHEALEQQTISIAKAGTITTMFSRCSVLAAANPKFGQFDEYNKTLREQINISVPLLSRFDLIFILKDQQKYDEDIQIAYSMLESSEPVKEKFEFQKYISYAREDIHPVESEEAADMLVHFYADWRKSALDNDSNPVTARQFMALKRLARASARARLSDTVTVEDVERAIRLEKYCISNNGYSVDKTNKVMHVKDKLESLREQIPILASEYLNKIPLSVLLEEGKKLKIDKAECNQWLRALDDEGVLVCDPELNEWSYRDYVSQNSVE